jgi:hypothetical protein
MFTSLYIATVISLHSKVASHASNPQPRGPGIYVPQWQGSPVIPPGTGFPFRRLLHGNVILNIANLFNLFRSKYLYERFVRQLLLDGLFQTTENISVRFEVFTAVTMKNAVFWDVAPCRSCLNRRFGGTYHIHLQSRKISERGTSRWLPAHAASSLADFSTLKMKVILSCETSVYTRPTRPHIPEDGIPRKYYCFTCLLVTPRPASLFMSVKEMLSWIVWVWIFAFTMWPRTRG